MSMDRLMNALAAKASALDASSARLRWGIVTSVDPSGPLARVLIQPEGVASQWMPILHPVAGSGFGIVAMPQVGQQVAVSFQEGDHGSGVILGAAYSTTHLPPQPGGNTVQPGEFAVVHPSGSFLHFRGQDVFVSGNRDVNVTAARNTTVTSVGTATVSATGAVTIASAASLALNAPAVSGGASGSTPRRLATEDFVLTTFNNHTHTGVTAGGATTGAPSAAAGSGADLTSTFKAI
jgi:phage baseplate assembly protein V